ncbi:MAG TPA: ABC transporter permease [Lacunisphaera sp.]|jgi:putative ABC transport system permease protein|nr:ABC transporter permease [Lacunisphaera sp.]
MRLGEILRMALGSLGVNKLRSFLTMSGITIGVFSVIGVMTAVTALRESIETGLSFLGSNMFQFAKFPVTGGGDGASRRRYQLRRDITLAQAMRYQQLMRDVTEVVCLKTFDQTGQAQAVYNGQKTTPGQTFGGTNEYFLTANQFTIDLGRNFTADDVELARPVIIIGQGILKKLFLAENPLGKRIKIRDRTYTVIGTFAEKGSQFGNSQDDIAMVPITRYLNDFGSERVSINIATQAPNQAVYNETIEKAITAMRIVRGLRPEDENDFELYSNDSLIAAFGKVADVIAAGSFVISGIALLAAGVGIMNIMLVSVTERTKEIGIRKSIGARKKNILTQFLIEAVTISLAGGLMGILLGVAGGNGVALMLKATAVFPWNWALIGVLVCSGIGVGFGFYPAWKASSLDPIEALRYE